MIQRYSSRRSPLKDFLAAQLQGARRYDRIAGFFSSSLLEVAGEALERMTPEGGKTCARVICNSCLNPLDVQTARAAKWGMHREWCASLPAEIGAPMKARLQRLYDFIEGGLLKVKVLPDEAFGLIHGKAGVITRTDGSQVCFIGSANESRTAWACNYELVWLDESEEGVRWVQEEFDALWSSPQAVDLAEAVVQDVARLIHRVVVPDIDSWEKEEARPAEPIVELPIYRRENGLWAHQKSFIKLAFDAHKNGGARYLLADQVGLGKTVQLALAAKLMALYGEKPILILVPKPLMIQWQDELWNLLEMPSARWNGRQWIDEQGVAYPEFGPRGMRKCPRRIGIMSTGLIVRGSETVDWIKDFSYECVILDEAHRARRSNLGPAHREEKAEPNNLLRFLMDIAPRSRSLLLATATPVQLDPIEAWDLLNALNKGQNGVLGSLYSRWRTRPREGIDLVLEQTTPVEETTDLWEWMRDPLPPQEEGMDFQLLRRSLNIVPSEYWAAPEAIHKLRKPDLQRVKRLSRDFFPKHNPFIRHIIRRTRDYLENTIDPHTNEPYLQRIAVRLFGESEAEAIGLPPFLRDAYDAAEEFCAILARRPGLNSGFMKTILLRRVGSTIEAGRLTAQQMLNTDAGGSEEEWENDAQESPASIYPLTEVERGSLSRFLKILEENRDEDPKLRQVERILTINDMVAGGWLPLGCIIFSQFYDSVLWLGLHLSKRMPNEKIGVYAGATKSGIIENGEFRRINRDEVKKRITTGELRLVIGTDGDLSLVNRTILYQHSLDLSGCYFYTYAVKSRFLSAVILISRQGRELMDLTSAAWLVWFLAGIAFMLAELVVPGFIIIFFGLGCWGAAVMAFFSPDAYSAQVAVFLIVSVATLITLRKVAMRVFVGRSEGQRTDDLGNVPVGARITLNQDLEPGRVGRVRFRGTMWDAVSEDRIPAGSDAEITGVDQANRSCLKIKSVSRV